MLDDNNLRTTTSSVVASATNSTSITLYNNDSLDNFDKWKRSFKASLERHTDRLLTIVTDNKLNLLTELKYKTHFTDTTWAAGKTQIIKEANQTAYILLEQTIGHQGTLDTIIRLHEGNAHEAYKYICSLWDAGDKA